MNGTTTDYFLQGSQILVQKTGNDELWFYYDSTGLRVAMTRTGLRVAMTLNGWPYYYLYNLLGDVVGLAKYDTGEIVAKYSYDAWGNCTVTNAANYSVGTKNPFRYRGYYYDDETGLYYLNSRYYNPEWGRFISADDSGDMGVEVIFSALACMSIVMGTHRTVPCV